MKLLLPVARCYRVSFFLVFHRAWPDLQRMKLLLPGGAVLPGKFLPSQKTLSRRKPSEFRSTEISYEISHEVGNIRWAKARFCAAPTESAHSGRAEQSSRRPQKFHTTNHFGEDRAQINLLASRRHFPL